MKNPADVSSRDISILNVMMDPKPILPAMFHPQWTWRQLRDITKDVRPYSRTARPVKYYFIDFGIAVRVPAGGDVRSTLGDACQDHDVPELSNTVQSLQG